MKQTIITMWLLIGVASYSLAAPFQGKPQKSNVSIEGKINFDDQYAIFISSLDKSNEDRIDGDEVEIRHDGTFHWKSYASIPQFIIVSFSPKKRDRQLGATFPLYVRPGMKLKLDLNYDNNEYLTFLSGKIDEANSALFRYANFENRMRKELYVNNPTIEKGKDFANTYLEEAEHLTQRFKKKDAIIKEYLNIWAFNNYQDALQSVVSENRRKDKNSKVPSEYYTLPKSPKEIYNSNLSLLIPQSNGHIDRYLGTLIKDKQSATTELRLKTEALKNTFSNERLVETVGMSLLTNYISSYRVGEKGFSQDVSDFSQVASIIQDENKRNRIIKDFENLKYTLVGAEMPDAVFKDANGKEVSLKSFKGKYVYIDLWASWCVPCIAEIPHLQKIEKEYADKNITFISLSIDASSTAWQNKMKELNLHGNQFEQGDSNFDKLMNVTGIPHFILYNPEGKLEMYKAPRPSAPVIKTLFEQIL